MANPREEDAKYGSCGVFISSLLPLLAIIKNGGRLVGRMGFPRKGGELYSLRGMVELIHKVEREGLQSTGEGGEGGLKRIYEG